MSQRFRGFLPVVVDVETGGFDSQRNALLEIAAVPIEMDENGLLYPARPPVPTWSQPRAWKSIRSRWK